MFQCPLLDNRNLPFRIIMLNEKTRLSIYFLLNYTSKYLITISVTES